VPRASSLSTLNLRAQQWGAIALDALPPRLQVRLSGKPPIQIDGDTLAPEVQLGLAVLDRRREPAPETLTPAEAREARRLLSAVYAGTRVEVGFVQDLEVPGGAGAMRARHYAPRELGDPHPLLVYYHGGGFTYGDLDTHDGVCRLLCRARGTR
jgi:acetyl esterase